MLEHIYVAVDIEKTGTKMIKYPVVSVGFVVASYYEVLERKRFNLKVNWTSENEGGDFEHRCLVEFWNKLPDDVINGCKENVLSQEEGWNEIANWINNLEVLYPEDKYTIKFLTDNASFDIATIDYNLEKYVNRNPMRYSLAGKYRSVISADDMLDMTSPKYVEAVNEYLNTVEDAQHTHNPVNDAYNIFLQYFYAQFFHYKNIGKNLSDVWTGKDNVQYTKHPLNFHIIYYIENVVAKRV